MDSIGEISTMVQVACRQLDVYCEETLASFRDSIQREIAAAVDSVEAKTRQSISILEKLKISQPDGASGRGEQPTHGLSECELQKNLECFSDRAWDLMCSEIYPLIQSRSRLLFEEHEQLYREKLAGMKVSADEDFKAIKKKYKKVIAGASEFVCASQRSVTDSLTMSFINRGEIFPKRRTTEEASMDVAIRSIALRTAIDSIVNAFEEGLDDVEELGAKAFQAWENTASEVSEDNFPHTDQIRERCFVLANAIVGLLGDEGGKSLFGQF